jgi:hypothetical protein
MRIPSHTSIVTTAFAAGMLFASAAYAVPATTPGSASHAGQPVSAATSAHKLASVTIDSGDPISALAAGYTEIDATTVKCTKPTCTIAVGITAQAGNQAVAQVPWAACAVVDGNFAPNGCPFLGELPTDNTYVTGATTQTFSVTKGTHAVSFDIYVTSAATAGVYDVQYELLTP